jgi:nicotinate-nucleotide adenylyltransferase
MAEAAADCMDLDRVLLLPASLPPHRGNATAPAEDRLAMCRLAVAGHPRLEVADLEILRQGRSYTVDTLHELQGRIPGGQLFLVLGWDAARDIRGWRQPDEVLRLARLVVVTRPGLPSPSPALLRRVGIDPEATSLCDLPTPDVRATEVRRALVDGGSLEGMVDPAVERYLRDRRLYGAANDAQG